MISFFRRRKAAPPAAAAGSPATARTEPVVTRQRHWRAAYPDRLIGGFSAGSLATPALIAGRDLRGLINHSRYAARNFDHARSYEMLCRRHVIGHEGIRLALSVTRDDGSPDLADTATGVRMWRDWGRLGGPTICGRFSWYDVERLTVTHIAREGGQFFRRHWGRGKYGYQIEPLPIDLLDLDMYQPAPGNGYIEAGVEFDADGRVVAGHFWSIAGDVGHRPGQRVRRRIPASDLIYVDVPEEFGLALGLPRMQTALRMMNGAEQFEEAAMAAADQGARHSLIYTQADGGELQAPVDPDAIPETLEPGQGLLLPPGMGAQFSDARFPDAAIEPFLRHYARGQAAGLGVAPETLTGDFGAANYSTLHVGKAEEREEWRMVQRSVAERLHGVVWRDLVKGAILSGAVPWPMRKYDKFATAADWRGRGWQAVDPSKQATADATDLANGTTTLSEICARRGRTVAEVAAERAADAAAFAAAGLGDPYATPAPASPAPQDGGGADAGDAAD